MSSLKMYTPLVTPATQASNGGSTREASLTDWKGEEAVVRGVCCSREVELSRVSNAQVELK